MITEYNSYFHSKALKNFPNLDFWFENTPSGNPGGGHVWVSGKSM
jgi:hypothetical protein